MTKRKRISARDLVALFTRKGGVCHLCKGQITPPEPWDVSHDRPLAMGGADDASNWDIAHRKCHKAHTAGVDVPQIAKAKRREAKAMGARPAPAKPIQSPPFSPPAKKPHASGIVRTPVAGMSEMARRYGVK